MKDIEALIGKVGAATVGSRELDAEITAFRNNAIVKPYPFADDFGPKNRWQFWSKDGEHFLGNESKIAVPSYTTDPFNLTAAVTLLPEGYAITDFSIWPGHPVTLTALGTVHQKPPGSEAGYWHKREYGRWDGRAATPALALTVAALKAKLAEMEGEDR